MNFSNLYFFIALLASIYAKVCLKNYKEYYLQKYLLESICELN